MPMLILKRAVSREHGAKARGWSLVQAGRVMNGPCASGLMKLVQCLALGNVCFFVDNVSGAVGQWGPIKLGESGLQCMPG